MPSRRDVVILASRALAFPGAQQFFSVWLQAAGVHRHGANPFAPPEPAWPGGSQPKFFSVPDFRMLETFTSILIPSDDTPGAREAHVARYIDFVLYSASEHAPEIQTEWRKAMDWLRGQRFQELAPADRASLMQRISLPERDRMQKHEGYAAYRLIKDLTVFAYYTSRTGMIDALEYKGNAYLKEFPACEHPEHKNWQG